MSVAIGIMQGRLSPPANGRIQSFPVATWREEFALARAAGLACIEWVYEQETARDHPLMTEAGIADLRWLSQQSGITVRSICADCYMTDRLITAAGEVRSCNVTHLRWLMDRAAGLGSRHIVLPFVDGSSLRSQREREALLALLREVRSDVERSGMALHIESDLSPQEQVRVMTAVNHPLIRITYDMGNCAAAGHDPQEELDAIGPWLGSVHVKDRTLGGGTVPLGTGAVDFPACFRIFHELGFAGPFILQAARDSSVTELEHAKRNRAFVEQYLEQAAWDGSASAR